MQHIDKNIFQLFKHLEFLLRALIYTFYLPLVSTYRKDYREYGFAGMKNESFSEKVPKNVPRTMLDDLHLQLRHWFFLSLYQ